LPASEPPVRFRAVNPTANSAFPGSTEPSASRPSVSGAAGKRISQWGYRWRISTCQPSTECW
jgi:hypothetical protein